MGHRKGGGERSESGFALLIVIGFLLAVTALITPFVLAARTSLDTAAATLRSDRLQFVAEGLTTVLAREVAALPEEELSRFAPGLRSDPVACRSNDLAIQLRVQDQRGLIDLNVADEALLEAGLRALGLDSSAAAAHARAIVAYRSSDLALGHSFPSGAGAILPDGPKKAPFEAVEELYDFEGLAAVPLASLMQAFTIHGRQPMIVGARMPDALARVLPRRPAPGFPFIANEAVGVGAVRIEVFVRAQDGTLGYAGLVASAAGASGKFLTVETSARPTITPGGQAPPISETSCEVLFGPAAAFLREFPA